MVRPTMTRKRFGELIAESADQETGVEARDLLLDWFRDADIETLADRVTTFENAQDEDLRTENEIHEAQANAERELDEYMEQAQAPPICESCNHDIRGPLLCRECAGKQAGQDSGFWGRAAARLQEKLNRTTLELQAERLIRG